jgi:hypothetical protein
MIEGGCGWGRERLPTIAGGIVEIMDMHFAIK